MDDAIALRDLRIYSGDTPLVAGLSLTLGAGRIVGMVGRSGSGKTLTARALLGLIDTRPGLMGGTLTITRDGETRTVFDGACTQAELDVRFAEIRGTVVGLLHQDARSALNPLFRVETQVRWAANDNQVTPWLARAGLQDPERVKRLFPHQLSGGMAQRVAIAMFLARGSRFLIADEPTTGLDPTVQQGLLDQLTELKEKGLGILLITHDLRILPRLADEILIVHGGRVVEHAPPGELFGGLNTEAGRALVNDTLLISGGLQ